MTTREFFDSIAGIGPVDVLALSLRATHAGFSSFPLAAERDVARSGDASSPAAGGGPLILRGEVGTPPPANFLEAACDARR